MGVNDLAQVIALDQQAFTLPWPESSFHFELEKNPASRCWVAEVNGEYPLIVGMIIVWVIVDEIHIATFAVNEEYRNQHIGQRLLAHTLVNGYEKGGEKSFLEVRRGNLAARELYRKFGFAEIGIRQKYYSDNGEDAIMMNLDPIDIELVKSFL
jgi:ribosomal-protein-alanine N-acetyltransferase